MEKMKPHKYNMIVAADEDWCIGKNGQLLDHFPEDMKLFKSITTNKIVIMGTNTQKSLPNGKYLKGRVNIILDNARTSVKEMDCGDDNIDTVAIYTPTTEYIPEFIKMFNDVQLKISCHKNFNHMTDGDIFVIGGGQVYRYFMEHDLIDTIYLTKIHHQYHGDTFIPNPYDLGFIQMDCIAIHAPNKNGIEYETFTMKKG